MVKPRLKRYGGKQRVARAPGSLLRKRLTAISKSEEMLLLSTFDKIII